MSLKKSISAKLASRNPEKALARARELKNAGDIARAFKLYVVAAEAGITEAERELGTYYHKGLGGHASAADAVRWFTRAAEKGDIESQTCLGGIYLSGYRPETALFGETQSGPADLAEALRWALMAAEAGEPRAQALAGFIYMEGPEELRDEEKAKLWYGRAAEADNPYGHLGFGLLTLRTADTDEPTFTGVKHIRKAAEAGLPLGHYYLAEIYEKAVGVLPDPAVAAEHYGHAAKGGIRNAQAKYGLMLLHGTGIKANKTEGETWLRRAALAGDPEAAALVADIYANGDGDLPPNYAEAANWFRVAAEAGHRDAARSLGVLYMLGAGGVPRDPDEAAKWFRQAAEAGDFIAQADLATLMLKKQTNPRFTEPAPVHEWFEKAAEAGDLIGAYNFAVCLAEGVGVEKDEARAVEWFRRAAENVLNAQHRLGRMLAEGRGVKQDFAEARVWLGKAASLNQTDALIDLAAMKLQGLGGLRNDEAACALFERAAANGSPEAMFALGALYGGGHQIVTDRAKSLEWYRKAAAAKHPRAALMLGKYLRLGIATAPDADEARKWLTVAAKAGLAEAEAELAALQAELEPPVATEE